MITTKHDGGSKFNFYWDNDKYLGFAYQETDGFYVFSFENTTGGVWSDYALKAISDKLFELNKEWNDIIKNDPRVCAKNHSEKTEIIDLWGE